MQKITEMKSEDLFKFVENFINVKIVKSGGIVKISYFELKIKMNMDEEDIDRFLKCSKIILEDQNYNVYLSGEEFEYEGKKNKVENNEFLVAIKIA
ncbi:unknown [Clostridium sp. CAG:492]|jgi:hypothetical protein|nr:unknown [Clostridium sp. CAG:492]